MLDDTNYVPFYILGRNKRLPDEGTKGLVAKKDSSTRGSVPVGRHAKQPFLVQTKLKLIFTKSISAPTTSPSPPSPENFDRNTSPGPNNWVNRH